MPRGKRVRSQIKEVVANVYGYFKELNWNELSQGSIKQTCDTTGVYVPTSKAIDVKYWHYWSCFFDSNKKTDCKDAYYLMILMVNPSDEKSTTSIKPKRM